MNDIVFYTMIYGTLVMNTFLLSFFSVFLILFVTGVEDVFISAIELVFEIFCKFLPEFLLFNVFLSFFEVNIPIGYSLSLLVFVLIWTVLYNMRQKALKKNLITEPMRATYKHGYPVDPDYRDDRYDSRPDTRYGPDGNDFTGDNKYD